MGLDYTARLVRFVKNSPNARRIVEGGQWVEERPRCH